MTTKPEPAAKAKTPRQKMTRTPDATPHPSLFPIVGIGASAGGLSAYEAFFSSLPRNQELGMAFIIVQHLSPDHKSILSELIKGYTNLNVHEVTDGIVVESDNIYIIPPSKDMALINGRLVLLEPQAERGHRLPIDFFFRSLADDQHERAICIVLSGTGSDGTLGARAIKGGGGLVIAQKPETAEYDGMPRSIVNNGLADFVASPQEIPGLLINYTTRGVHILYDIDIQHFASREDNLNKIFLLIRHKTGHDFSHYKPKTILRRLERRMAINQIDNLTSYLSYLQQNAAEADVLFHDMLIGVTSFFRDPAAFSYLQQYVLPLLFESRTAESVIRIWVPACSTGEEAYSIAIMMQEYKAMHGFDHTIRIFATDLDKAAIAHARAGVYSQNISADVTPERLARYFILNADDHTYQIHKSIREMIVFSEQNLIKDPPFSRMDFISCRNLLIYLDSGMQKKVISLFHYALSKGGILFLGTSESIGELAELFTPLSRNNKIYQRSETDIMRPLPSAHLTTPYMHQQLPGKTSPIVTHKQISYKEITEAELVKQYAPAAALINADGKVLYVHGRTGKFLELASGEADHKLVKMARPGLQKELTNGINTALRKKESVYIPQLKVKTNGDYSTINLRIKPLSLTTEQKARAGGGILLVVFEDVLSPVPDISLAPVLLPSSKQSDLLKTIVALQAENQSKDEYIQTSVEEMETYTAEISSANEELQSLNEELQSSNEELETSREELQSLNEELTTVNAELQNKIINLSKAENDLNNLLSSTGVGTVFVDLGQIIKRYTPAVVRIIKLIRSDVGRPISDIATNLLNYDTLSTDIQSVLDTLVPIEKEVRGSGDVWYQLRIMPYRTLENVIDGAVITFVDITMIKQAELFLNEYKDIKRLTAVVKDANDAITMLGLNGEILAWNPAATRMYGYTEVEAMKMNIVDIIPEVEKNSIRSVLSTLDSNILKPFSAVRIHKNGTLVHVMVTASALIDRKGAVYAIATTEKLE